MQASPHGVNLPFAVDTRGRGGVRGRGECGGATSFDLAFLAVEVGVVDIEQERFFWSLLCRLRKYA
jgi:hypothetical protein